MSLFPSRSLSVSLMQPVMLMLASWPRLRRCSCPCLNTCPCICLAAVLSVLKLLGLSRLITVAQSFGASASRSESQFLAPTAAADPSTPSCPAALAVRKPLGRPASAPKSTELPGPAFALQADSAPVRPSPAAPARARLGRLAGRGPPGSRGWRCTEPAPLSEARRMSQGGPLSERCGGISHCFADPPG